MTVYAILTLLTFIFSGVMAISVVMIKRQQSRTEQYFSDQVDNLFKEIRAVSHGSMGIGRKSLVLEQRIQSLEDQIKVLQSLDSSDTSYAEATRLVEMGAGIYELMNNCGISRPEAELVTALTQHSNEKIPTLVHTA